MSKSLIYLIVLINYSEAKFKHTDNPAITFRYNEVPETDFKVERDKPFDIVLDNFFANFIWCLNFYYKGPEDQFVKHMYLRGSSDAVIHIANITEAMFTKWWCVILQDYRDGSGKPYEYLGRKYTAHNLVFNLHDKYSNELFDKKMIFIISVTSGILITILLIICTIIMIKICCCQKPKPLQFTRDPASVFYLNLEIFRRQYERELQEQEPEYEEIN